MTINRYSEHQLQSTITRTSFHLRGYKAEAFLKLILSAFQRAQPELLISSGLASVVDLVCSGKITLI